METAVGWPLLIIGATGLLIRNINWYWVGFKKKECK